MLWNEPFCKNSRQQKEGTLMRKSQIGTRGKRYASYDRYPTVRENGKSGPTATAGETFQAKAGTERTWSRRTEMVGQDGHRISLAGLSVHGAWHASRETFMQRGPWDQPIGSDCQATRYRLLQGQVLKRQPWADRKIIAKIQGLPGKKTWTEAIVDKIMRAKLKMGM